MVIASKVTFCLIEIRVMEALLYLELSAKQSQFKNSYIYCLGINFRFLRSYMPKVSLSPC